MGCRAENMEPRGSEVESKAVAKHIKWLIECGIHIMYPPDLHPGEVSKAIAEYYGLPKKVDQLTLALCSTIKAMNEESLDKFVYNGRLEEARQLASWWDKHQGLDKTRDIEELGNAVSEITDAIDIIMNIENRHHKLTEAVYRMREARDIYATKLKIAKGG